jgi:hypothetical protein
VRSITARRVVAAAAGLALCASTIAGARTGANVTGVTVHGPDGPRATGGAASTALATMARAVGTAAAPVVDAPLAAGAEQIDSTYYDLQDMGSLGARVVIDAAGTVHVTYQKEFCELAGSCPPNLNDPDPFPWRGMGYAYRSGDAWARLGKVQDPSSLACCGFSEHLGGFGTIALTPTGRAAIAQHMNEHICFRRGVLYLQNTVGAASWKQYPTQLPGVNPDYLEFPQITANPNGSFTILAEDPRGGAYDGVEAFQVAYLPGTSTSYSCPGTWPFGAWVTITTPSMFHSGHPGFPSLASSSNGRVGVAVGDLGGNVWLIESSNGTFGAGTITTRKLTDYADSQITKADSTSAQYRPYIHCHLAYNDTTPNVVWSELQARKVGSTIEYHDFRSRIVHWDPIRGVEVVKQVAGGEADRFDDVDQDLAGPLPGQNHISVDWPQVGFSSDGLETYVVWLRYSDSEIDTTPGADMGLTNIVTGLGYGDIAASATRAGDSWDAPVNLTQTPATDERYVSVAQRNPDGRVHVVYQSSATNQAGSSVLLDRGPQSNPALKRRVAYLSAPLGATVAVGGGLARLTAHTIVAFPNPSAAHVRFTLAGGGAALPGARLDVYTVAGRHVARVTAERGGDFVWDGRGAGGERVAAGVYFARLAGERGARAGARPTRFMLIH